MVNMIFDAMLNDELFHVDRDNGIFGKDVDGNEAKRNTPFLEENDNDDLSSAAAHIFLYFVQVYTFFF